MIFPDHCREEEDGKSYITVPSSCQALKLFTCIGSTVLITALGEYYCYVYIEDEETKAREVR